MRLDGYHRVRLDDCPSPTLELTAGHLTAAIEYASRVTAFCTSPHPRNPGGWVIRWIPAATPGPHPLTATSQVADERTRVDEAIQQNKPAETLEVSTIVPLTRSAWQKAFVASHAAFGYFAQRYGLGQIAIAGLSPEEEPRT
jgi:hypothetical protein